jgi:hypothetical protein
LRRTLINLRLQSGVEPFVSCRIGSIAYANQKSFGRKQPAAAAAVDRLSRGGVVGLAPVLIDGSDLRRPDAGVRAFVTADGERAIAGADRVARRSNADGPQTRSADADQGDIAVEIVADELAIGGLGRAAAKHVGSDSALAFGFAEQVAAGDNERFAVMRINHGAGAEAVASGVFDFDADGGCAGRLFGIQSAGS